MKIGVIDIETLPAEVYVFDLFNQNISLAQIKEPVRVGGFGWRWLHEDKAKFYGEGSLTHREVIEKGFALMDEADAIITYNGDRFDIPHMQREFAELHLGRTSPFVSIDLFKVVKKHHKFLSRKLAHVVERLELRHQKLGNDGWELWIGCLNKEPASWRDMETYCLGDVDATTDLYYDQLPWIDNHPNVPLYDGLTEQHRCPKCKSTHVIKRGFRMTKIGSYQRYQCLECGSWSSDGKRIEGVALR